MQDRPKGPLSRMSIVSFAWDPPNLCSLAGLLCAILGIYYAVVGVFQAAMIGMLWAVLFDGYDGIIARRLKGRTDEHKAFGAQLDSLIDVVSFSVCPSVVLLSYGGFSPWLLPGAFVIVSTGVMRLSYFSVFGLVDKSTYMGLALDNNVVILSAVFLLHGLIAHDTLVVILYTTLMALAILNVAPIRTPKLAGKWFRAITFYILGMTAIYGWLLMRA